MLFGVILLTGMGLTVFQSNQFKNSAIQWDSMTKDAYWETFAKHDQTQLFASYLRYPVTEKALRGIDAVYAPVYDTVYSIHKSFDQPAPMHSVFSTFQSGKRSFKGKGALYIPKENLYALDHPVSVADANRIYVTAWTQNADELVLVLSGNDAVPFYSASGEICATQNKWDKVHFYTTLPDNFALDSLYFYVWNKGNKNFWIDELNVTATFCNYVEKIR